MPRYGLKTVAADMTAHGGFVWPREGAVAAPDWDPTPECGRGLHLLLDGCGDGGLLRWESAARWLVVEIADGTPIVDFGGNVKVPSCTVIHCGDRESATSFLAGLVPVGTLIVGGTATAGYRGTAAAGYRGTATAGDYGTATAGNRGTATAGDYGTAAAGYQGAATAGDEGTATAGNRGIATAGYRGAATAGDYGIAIAGDYGIATAGYRGAATAGDYGIAIAGDYGIATAGPGGTAIAGPGGKLVVRGAVGYVGEGGIEPGVAYRCDHAGQLVRADS